jgi:mannose-6-phosphate isomerase-like protein (cupin superfamily)
MDVININSVPSFITKDSSIIREILAPANSSIKKQSLAEATLPAGKETIEHYHTNTEEIYFILKGKGRIRIDDEIMEISQGDAIGILPGKKHKVWNTGDSKLVFLCCCTPAYKHEDTVTTE